MPSLTPLSGGTETLTALAELVASPEITIPGLLPSSSTLPGATTYPRDTVIIPAVVGPALTAVAADTQTLTPLLEA